MILPQLGPQRHNRCQPSGAHHRPRSGNRQRQRHAHGGAGAGRAVDHDAAAHHFGETAADGQAQAGAAIEPRGVHAGLLERLEQARLRLCCHADAGVLDRQAHRLQVIAAAAAALNKAGAQLDHTILRELDRVADKIAQHLQQAQRVGQQRRADARVNRVPQDQAFGIGHRMVGIDDARQQRGQLHRFGHNGHLARFNLGVIENVVNDAAHGTARLARDRQRLGLLAVQRRQRQQFKRAHQPVHRRADLMAHGGQEGVLGSTRVLGRFLGCQQGLLSLFARGDVARNRDQPEQAAIVIAHRHFSNFVPDPVQVGLALHPHRAWRAHRPRIIGHDRIGLLWRLQLAHTAPNHVRHRLAIEIGFLAVQRQIAARCILERDAVRQAIEQRAQLLLGRLLRHLGPAQHILLQRMHHDAGQRSGKGFLFFTPAPRRPGVFEPQHAIEPPPDPQRRIERRGNAVRTQISRSQFTGARIRLCARGIEHGVAGQRGNVTRIVGRTQLRAALMQRARAIEQVTAHDGRAVAVKQPDPRAPGVKRARPGPCHRLQERAGFSAIEIAQRMQHAAKVQRQRSARPFIVQLLRARPNPRLKRLVGLFELVLQCAHAVRRRCQRTSGRLALLTGAVERLGQTRQQLLPGGGVGRGRSA